MSESERRFVLLTGAAGRIGTAFREAHGERYRFRLADLHTDTLADTPGTDHEIIRLDIADADACREACAGIDTVIHLAADPSPEADWETSLLPNNIRASVNVFRAAQRGRLPPGRLRQQRPRRSAAIQPTRPSRTMRLLARSISTGRARFSEKPSPPTSQPRASPASPSALARTTLPGSTRAAMPPTAMAYVSARDLNDLLVRCIETEDIPYAVVAGISDNARKRFDLNHTQAAPGLRTAGRRLQGAGIDGDGVMGHRCWGRVDELPHHPSPTQRVITRHPRRHREH